MAVSVPALPTRSCRSRPAAPSRRPSHARSWRRGRWVGGASATAGRLDPHVGADGVLGLLDLGAVPGARVRRREDSDRDREHEEEHRARVGTGAARELPEAERRDGPARPGREPLDERSRERDRPQREQGSREQEEGRSGHEERVDAEASLVRDECPVVPTQLPVAEQCEPRDEKVEVRALGEPREGGPAPLACDRDPPRPQSGKREPEDADCARCCGKQVRGGRDVRLEVHADVRERPDVVERPERAGRQPRREGDRGHGDEGRLDERERRDLERRPPTQPQGLGHAVAALEQERGGDDQPVRREQRELDERHQHPGPCEMERVVGLVEDPRQVRLDVELLSGRPALVEACGEARQPSSDGARLVEREPRGVRLEPPAEALVPEPERVEALARGDERPGARGRQRVAPPERRSDALRTVRPDHADGHVMRRVEPALRVEDVADAKPEVGRHRARQSDLDGARARRGPPAGLELGVRGEAVDETECDRALLGAERLGLAARERRHGDAVECVVDALAHAPVEAALGAAREHVDHELDVRVLHGNACETRPQAALRHRVGVDRDRGDETCCEQDDEERGAGHEPVGRGCLQGQAPAASAHVRPSGTTRRERGAGVRVSARCGPRSEP